MKSKGKGVGKMKKSEFYTLKGYQLKKKEKITEAMEDYLEMITRFTLQKKEIRIKDLALKLNVKPPSVSKMMNRLKELNFVSFEKYKTIHLTEEGITLGKYLLERHNVLVAFFKKLNKEDYNLKQVEMIEHFIDYPTIQNMKKDLNKKV